MEEYKKFQRILADNLYRINVLTWWKWIMTYSYVHLHKLMYVNTKHSKTYYFCFIFLPTFWYNKIMRNWQTNGKLVVAITQ